MTTTAETILSWLYTQEENMLAFLEEMVKAESPSRDRYTQEPVMGLLIQKLQEVGYKVIRVPGRKTGGYLYAVPKNRDRAKELQMMIGHCDTVWPIGTLEKMPVKQENGQMRGPGVYDMKAGLTQMLFTLQGMQELGLEPPLVPLVVINSDEEIGSRESTFAIRRLAKISRRAFVMEPPLGLDGRLKTARKGLGRFTITVRGVSAHAGLDPGKGASAIMELSYQIQQLFAMNDLERGITVNVGMVEGGISPNVVAPESRAVVDVRVLTQAHAEEITQRIKALEPITPETTLQIEGFIGRPPMERTPENQALWRLARKEGKKLGLELEQATAGGGSDGNTTSLFCATLDGLGTVGDGAHAKHEFIYLDKLIERTALLTLLTMAEPK